MSPSANTEEYRSGDPSLAFVDDKAEKAPTFDDPYEERKYLKHRLALGFRVLANFGLAEGVAGYVTVRNSVDPNSFWVYPFGLYFSLIRDEDLIRVDHEGKVVNRGKNRRLNYGAYAIYAEIYKARPDVLCAAYSHSTYGRAFCATGRTLDMLT
ncbi:hypothetical protein FOMG_17718 [Fusarium oxysporum f. sp. melonis 26406]|uniref:Class II aldolase/adducin N-terminal domain-containing protein n=1 Tax=Fusarium oxysporum f. sp. melonis 26406 TaxID=1089452 RepID=W9ZX51_FUSOX|nr:hypothetical protein FOMG_17718 [Fusarium oxysporum f. sp. melonis 26406]